MRINVAASHRFHLLDLAVQLEAQGHEVRFYSYVPTRRAKKYGLKRKNSYSFFYFAIPFLAINKLSGRASWAKKLMYKALDIYVSTFMKPCDVFIGLGSVYHESFVTAKKKYDSITILEWGSKHIDEQQNKLTKGSSSKQHQFFTERTKTGYSIADYIAIASDHVKEGFMERGYREEKLLQNPYGVDLAMFKPTKLSKNHYDVIMVGGWRYAKGCDLIVEYFTKSEFTFLHVGSLVDMAFPNVNNMTHIDSVDQVELIDYYRQARIFLLPSRAEGLAMVQAQAIACGLPIVCSKDSGGRDLRKLLSDQKWIIEMKSLELSEMDRCIRLALEYSNKQTDPRSYSQDVANKLSWEAYGKRYNKNLEKIVNQNTNLRN